MRKIILSTLLYLIAITLIFADISIGFGGRYENTDDLVTPDWLAGKRKYLFITGFRLQNEKQALTFDISLLTNNILSFYFKTDLILYRHKWKFIAIYPNIGYESMSYLETKGQNDGFSAFDVFDWSAIRKNTDLGINMSLYDFLNIGVMRVFNFAQDHSITLPSDITNREEINSSYIYYQCFWKYKASISFGNDLNKRFIIIFTYIPIKNNFSAEAKVYL